MPKPKFEKADDNTIRIIIEKVDEVPLAKLIENRKKLLEYKKTLQEQLKEAQTKIREQEEAVNQSLKNIDEILIQAERLGITAKKEKDWKQEDINKKDKK